MSRTLFPAPGGVTEEGGEPPFRPVTEADHSNPVRWGQLGKGVLERPPGHCRNRGLQRRKTGSEPRVWRQDEAAASPEGGTGPWRGGQLTEDKHAASVDNGRVVVAGGWRGAGGEGPGGVGGNKAQGGQSAGVSCAVHTTQGSPCHPQDSVHFSVL